MYCILGCDRGFGHALALRLQGTGVAVYAGCLEVSQSGARELTQAGITVLQMDVTKQDQVEKAVQMIEQDTRNGKTWKCECLLLKLTLKVLVTTINAQWEGMGDVGSARYEPALLPPYQTIRVLSYSN